MKITTKRGLKHAKERALLSYLTPQEKHQLVGSFVVENFWDAFIKANIASITTFRQIAKDSIPSFIEAYQDVWDYVVGINLLDDIFLSEHTRANKSFKGLSPYELRTALQLLSLSLYSELEKDCLMALNKTILIELASDLRERYGFTEEEYQLLVTPSFETFFTKYHFDHFEFAVTADPIAKDVLQEKLIANFHAHDPELFALRFATMYFPDTANSEELFASQKHALAERSAKKMAFIGTRDDLQAFEKLLEYDNFLDFKYRYNLQACPEYFVRKLLFAACKAKGIFYTVERVLSLEDGELIAGVTKLTTLAEKSYCIELDPALDITQLTQSLGFDKAIRKNLYKDIKQHLANGSPCAVRVKPKKDTDKLSAQTMLLIGYEENALIAKDDSNQIVRVSESDLHVFDELCVVPKYDQAFMTDFQKSIQTFIDRTPYLNRKIYEKGF